MRCAHRRLRTEAVTDRRVRLECRDCGHIVAERDVLCVEREPIPVYVETDPQGRK